MPTFELKTRKIVARLRKDGWIAVGGSKHEKFEHGDRPDVLITGPRHQTAVRRGTLDRQTGRVAGPVR
jgi:hypothetical protein